MNDKDTSVIPLGLYCYSRDDEGKRKACPYWSIDPTHEKQDNGYCSYLEKGDWSSLGWGLLWDQVKECEVNEDWETLSVKMKGQ